MSMTYHWGRLSFSVPAQLVGETVAAIAATDGSCPPERLVANAEPESSPLHPLFTWDDAHAATNWRTHEARQAINSLEVAVSRDGHVVPMPAFVSVVLTHDGTTAERGYQPVSVVLNDEDATDQALADVLAKLAGLRRRYNALSELAPVWHAVDIVQQTIGAPSAKTLADAAD